MTSPAASYADQRAPSPTARRPAPSDSISPAAGPARTARPVPGGTANEPATGNGDSVSLNQAQPGNAPWSALDAAHPTSTLPPPAASSPRASHMARDRGHGRPLSPELSDPGRESVEPPGSLGEKPAQEPASSPRLNDYRERLARDLERRELSARALVLNSPENRVSPIPEEGASSVPHGPSTTTTTASTESGNTVRGGMTPGNLTATPSYPFPRMPPSSWPQTQKPFSPAGARFSPRSGGNFPSFGPAMGAQDRVLSNDSTPASFIFNPEPASSYRGNFDFPEPNLYELSLMLSAEPGLDAWWNTVVQIMRDVYKAERVTLSVPADTTDIENVPWGQKATYNEHQGDDLSLAYLGKRSSAQPTTSDFESPGSIPNHDDGRRTATPVRPELFSRHSFTSYEDSRPASADQSSNPARRPADVRRSRSYWSQKQATTPAADREQLSRGALEEHDLLVEGPPSVPPWESPYPTEPQNRGRVLPVLQALAYEADPLIDHSGVIRVLERGKTVTLTRSYPYLESTAPADNQRAGTRAAGADPARKPARPRSESATKRPSLFGNSSSSRGPVRSKTTAGDRGKAGNPRTDDDGPRPPTPKYEEYEQAPQSPWSQSPAPSPAVRTDTKENPFFADATVDEESFNPGTGPTDYTVLPPPEAIGIDNSWTVLHVPLPHVLLSKPASPFKLDSRAVDQAANAQPKDGGPEGAASPEAPPRAKPAPIAILSVLSPVIPYPANLRHSLEHLAPHMATSFSLCRHYDNLETEIAGLKRRRPSTTGFGAVALDGRPLSGTPYLGSDAALQRSHTGSLTSPSEYSVVSKSMTGSPAGTPGWDQPSLGGIVDKRPQPISPAAVSHGAEGYFASKQRSAPIRHDVLAGGTQRREGTKESLPAEKRLARKSSAKSSLDLSGTSEATEKQTAPLGDGLVAPSGKPPSRGQQGGASTSAEDVHVLGDAKDRLPEASRHERVPSHGHTMLHSYGADFSSTFQSLPPSSTLVSRPASSSTQGRSVSYLSSAADMPPPSDKLKGLMLDALPAHVFVAMPQTGEVVWVNSRYLSYRGQTVADLAEDPWSSIHPDDCDEYLKAWGHSLRTGEQFSRTVRIKRFDGQYRWFYARAVASKDKRGVIRQFLGSYMDIHDQHIAELKAARQEEIEASEAKHRLLANLIPQIIFTATEEDGITFANEQWLSYTGQGFDDLLGLGFLDYVHPDDLARCRIPTDQPPTLLERDADAKTPHEASPTGAKSPGARRKSRSPTDANLRGVYKAFSRRNSSGNSSIYEVPSADLTELAKKGIIKVGTDSNGRLSYTTEVRLRSKTGEYRWHLIRCVEIDTIDFGSGASSYFGSATDINDHKILETKLKEAMEAKGRFLSNMSHEIRTPLIGISGMVSFLQDTILNEEQRDYTNTIQTSANSLIMIINDILDLSKVDAGMMKLKFEWFHTRSLIEDVNELVSTMAIAKGLELNYLVEADVPAWVKGDKVRIRQVLLNVIGNAIKFTTKGEVFSHCRVYSDPASLGNSSSIMLEYAIIDTGQGFTQQEAELIFKPFSQIDGSSTRQHGGSGLGLVISKQLVELHGGKMGGTATPGKGSKFVFTARFGLPTEQDHPDLPGRPSPTYPAPGRPGLTEKVPVSPQALPPNVPERDLDGAGTGAGVKADAKAEATGMHPVTQDASKPLAAAVSTGLARFSEAAKASGQDLSQMKLEMTSGVSSPGRAGTPTHPSEGNRHPPMYSILVICPQKYSREATTQHIEMTLPSDMPHQVTAVESVEEAQRFIGGEDPIKFTHIVINLGSPEAVMKLLDQIAKSQKVDNTTILILSDSVQRQAVMKLAVGTPHERLLSDNEVTFIYKPVKPSRFAVIFDPDKMRDLSIDRNRSTAQRMVETQKASYLEIEKRMGNKGYKVLLVEDNPVNQKVLNKYLKKIGVDVDVAIDGSECTDMVLSRDHSYYSLILCDLHMPRKDGYQACREIRQWEKTLHARPMPIIALSANVMSDVHDKCVAAGFSDYVTKPVDFIDLSKVMVNLF